MYYDAVDYINLLKLVKIINYAFEFRQNSFCVNLHDFSDSFDQQTLIFRFALISPNSFIPSDCFQTPAWRRRHLLSSHVG